MGKIPGRRDWLPTPVFLSFPGGSGGIESTCNAGDLSSIPGLGRSPGGEHDHPLQYSCLENPHGQRSLEGYNPWDYKELDMTERLSSAQHGKDGVLVTCRELSGSRGSLYTYTNLKGESD